MSKFLSHPLGREVFDFVMEIHDGQMFGDKTYDYHLLGVNDIYVEAGMDELDDFLIAVAHDSIEDCGEENRPAVINFLQPRLTPHSYCVVWALSGLGPNRKARNLSYYDKIGCYPRSANYKLGDRIFNVRASKSGHPRKFTMYQNEDEVFSERVVALATNQFLIDTYRDLLRP